MIQHAFATTRGLSLKDTESTDMRSVRCGRSTAEWKVAMRPSVQAVVSRTATDWSCRQVTSGVRVCDTTGARRSEEGPSMIDPYASTAASFIFQFGLPKFPETNC